MYRVGQSVYVDMRGFSHGGVSFGALGGAELAGVVMGANADGTYEVRLGASIAGVSDVTVGPGRLRAA